MRDTQLRLAVTPEFKERFKNHCKDRGKNMSMVLENLIKNYLNEDMEKELNWRRNAMSN